MRKMQPIGSDLERRLRALEEARAELRRAIEQTGATPEQLSVMRAIEAGTSTWDELARATALPGEMLECAVEALLERGHVCVAIETFALTEAGEAWLVGASRRLDVSDKVVATRGSPRRFVS